MMAMFKALIGLGVGLIMVGLATRAEAFSFSQTETDQYWGGTNENTTGWGDVIGTDPPFGIASMHVYKNENDNTLYVDITTNYSGIDVGAIGTSAGALFLGDLDNLDLNGATQSNMPYGDADIYYDGTGNPHADAAGRFSHALDYTDANGNAVANPGTGQSDTGSGGGARLYALNGNATDVVTSNHPFLNRNGQAYDVYRAGDSQDGTFTGRTVNTSAATAVGSTWYTANNIFSFTIADFFSTTAGLTGVGEIYEFGATFAWTMLCGNDVILVQINWDDPLQVGQVPIPAGLVLLFSGLFGLGFLGRIRAKRVATAVN